MRAQQQEQSQVLQQEQSQVLQQEQSQVLQQEQSQVIDETKQPEPLLEQSSDLARFEKIHDDMASKVDELEARMKDVEIHFERDPKTNRIVKAKHVKRTVQ